MCVPWVSAIWKAESLVFKVLHACVVVAVEQCRKCVRVQVVFDPAGETKSCASTQCYQGYVHVWAGLLQCPYSPSHASFSAQRHCKCIKCHFQVKTIREDYQCLVCSELIDLVQLRYQRQTRTLIWGDMGNSSEKEPSDQTWRVNVLA